MYTHFSFRFDGFHVSLSHLPDSFTSPEFFAHDSVAYSHHGQRHYVSHAQKQYVVPACGKSCRNIIIIITIIFKNHFKNVSGISLDQTR